MFLHDATIPAFFLTEKENVLQRAPMLLPARRMSRSLLVQRDAIRRAERLAGGAKDLSSRRKFNRRLRRYLRAGADERDDDDPSAALDDVYYNQLLDRVSRDELELELRHRDAEDYAERALRVDRAYRFLNDAPHAVPGEDAEAYTARMLGMIRTLREDGYDPRMLDTIESWYRQHRNAWQRRQEDDNEAWRHEPDPAESWNPGATAYELYDVLRNYMRSITDDELRAMQPAAR